MPFNPQPKVSGDLIRSIDWNEAMSEIVRLEVAKFNVAGGQISGQLTVDSGFTGGTEPALKVLHNGSFNWGQALAIEQNLIGNSDGPKIRFNKAMTVPKSWSAGIINGVNAGHFVISEDPNSSFGASRLCIAPGGNVGLGTNDPKELFQIGDRWTFHNGGTKFIGYNAFFNGASDARIVDGAASQLRFNSDGSLVFKSISNGTAGSAITGGSDITFSNGGVEAQRFSLGDSTQILRGSLFFGRLIFPPPPPDLTNYLNVSFGSFPGAPTDPYLFRVGHVQRGTVTINSFFVTKLSVDQNGNLKASGTISPPNADYAEFFESENGKEISIGTAVVVGKEGTVRPAKQGEIPIGIVTKTPGILGNNPMEWPKQHLRDEYGNLLMENYEEDVPVSDEAAEELKTLLEGGEKLSAKDKKRLLKKAKGTRPKLNPEYDPQQAYRSREERAEWQIVGLLGQLHLTKGQPVAPQWVKLRDVSPNVELYLVK